MRLLPLILFLAFSMASFAQMSCNDLVQYRDSNLLETYDKLAFNYQIQQDYISDIEVLIKDTQSDKFWNNVGFYAKTINMITDFISSLSGGDVYKSMKVEKVIAFIVSNQIEKAVDKGIKEMNAVAKKSYEDKIKNNVVNLIPVVNAVKKVLEDAKDIEDASKASTLINKALKQLKSKLEIAKQQLENKSLKIEAFNDYKNYLDTYLSTNCK